MIPEFRRDGQLPPGVHPADWTEFQRRFSQTPRRQTLLAGMLQATRLQATRLLKLAGCQTLYIDGSFITNKPEPGDFDACWDVSGVELALLAPIFLDFSSDRAAQKAQFGGELFPAQLPEGSTGQLWLDFFQRDRNGRSKGVVALRLEDIPGEAG